MFNQGLLITSLVLLIALLVTVFQNNQYVARKEVQNFVEELKNEIQASTQTEIKELRNLLLKHFPSYPKGTRLNPATSCKELPPKSLSDYYWIIGPGLETPKYTYCDMSRRCCNSAGGWMRVANLNMTDPNQQCPKGFRPVSSPVRACGRPGGGCVSIIFPVHGVEYSKVCGMIIGYQYSSPDAFEPYYLDRSLTIDDIYVDGVSLTHGQYPRKHIWTFANAVDEIKHDPAGPFPDDQQYKCPCTHTDRTFTGFVPSFVGQDYFCETGSREFFQWKKTYTEDPLWDGKGCGHTSSCCTFNNPPWFCKQLPQLTRDNIELRLCCNIEIYNEDVLLEIVELYIQ